MKSWPALADTGHSQPTNSPPVLPTGPAIAPLRQSPKLIFPCVPYSALPDVFLVLIFNIHALPNPHWHLLPNSHPVTRMSLSVQLPTYTRHLDKKTNLVQLYLT